MQVDTPGPPRGQPPPAPPSHGPPDAATRRHLAEILGSLRVLTAQARDPAAALAALDTALAALTALLTVPAP